MASMFCEKHKKLKCNECDHDMIGCFPAVRGETVPRDFWVGQKKTKILPRLRSDAEQKVAYNPHVLEGH